MLLININNILYVWNIHYDILSALWINKMSILNIDKDTFSICSIEKLPVSVIEKNIFVYITYGHF